MKTRFEGWQAVAERLVQEADRQQELDETAARLNQGQRASLRSIAALLEHNGVLIADEVGMGKTRIAVDVARCVVESGGRVAILVPPGLGYQWQTELNDGGIKDIPPILRSFHGYLNAWTEGRKPWFSEPVVVVSHMFTNWRLGEATHPWRWALVPEVYAAWRRATGGRLPRNYRNNEILGPDWISSEVAESIVGSIPKRGPHPICKKLNQLLEVWWPIPLDAAQYSKDGELRQWLERIVGFGLGVFDLVIIDEAHKNRRHEGGLSRLINNVIVSANSARRLAITATPVELNVSQWESTLARLGLDDRALDTVNVASERYATAVKRLRQTWQTSEEARDEYKLAAEQFQHSLSPYLLRRDKRKDPDIMRFQKHSKVPPHEYRRQTEISVETSSLTPAWRKAICAAEALSVVARQADDSVAKRLRLTIGNGHGIATLLDHIKRDEDDRKQEQQDATETETPKRGKKKSSTADRKREERVKWWLGAISRAFDDGDNSLFEHPAIQAAVDEIEKATQAGEKVLVFGRFTRPMRALVNLLNAREMLRRVSANKPWPQAKVHDGEDGEESEWPAVRAAHCQLKSDVVLEKLNSTLRKAYDRERRKRHAFSDQLLSMIDQGRHACEAFDETTAALFEAFSRSVETSETGDGRSATLIAKVILDQLGASPVNVSPVDCAGEFAELIKAASDNDDADDDTELDDEQATARWETIELRLNDEYNRPQGGFARLMYGGTRPESRRMIQLAFNRHASFPRVLVAQSLVGREGLNLHKACRIVVLLHPEWNPGIVEQQIGRVDRVGSHWSKKLNEAIEACDAELPRIEVHPIIFRGTYDEWNWEVLKTRWDNLRAQLHGVVIPPTAERTDPQAIKLIKEIERLAPNFSPGRITGSS